MLKKWAGPRHSCWPKLNSPNASALPSHDYTDYTDYTAHSTQQALGIPGAGLLSLGGGSEASCLFSPLSHLSHCRIPFYPSYIAELLDGRVHAVCGDNKERGDVPRENGAHLHYCNSHSTLLLLTGAGKHSVQGRVWMASIFSYF